MSHIWLRHVTCMNESCRTYESVRTHVWMSHVTHMNQSCHTCQWVTSHTWMGHVSRMNVSCHTYEYVMTHVWMSHVTRSLPLIIFSNKKTYIPFLLHATQIRYVHSYLNSSWHIKKEKKYIPLFVSTTPRRYIYNYEYTLLYMIIYIVRDSLKKEKRRSLFNYAPHHVVTYIIMYIHYYA